MKALFFLLFFFHVKYYNSLSCFSTVSSSAISEYERFSNDWVSIISSLPFSAGDVSVHRVDRLRLWIQRRLIREFRDQRLFDNYPELFAVFHARHRLLTPRHPPCALSSLTTNIHNSPPPHQAIAGPLT